VEGSAAVATVGLSVLAKGLWGRWFSSKTPCQNLYDKARKQYGDEKGSWLDDVVDAVTPGD